MRDMTVGLILFGFFTIFGFVLGMFAGYLSWAEVRDDSYLVYEWTRTGGSTVVASHDNFTDAVSHADDMFGLHNRVDFADDWNGVRDYYIVHCGEVCQVVYP